MATYNRFISTMSSLALLSVAFAAALAAQSPSSLDKELEHRIAGSAPMPRVLLSADPTMPPTFVAADQVLLADGTVDASLFRPGEVFMIEQDLAQEPSEDCIRLDIDSSEHLPVDGETPSIAKTLHKSENAVVAEVTGRIFGYMGADPGTLLRVETQEVLSGQSIREDYLIHFPVGSFKVGEHRICRTTTGFPNPPGLGDQVLLLYHDTSVSDRTEFLNLRAMDVVVLPAAGAIRFSSYLTSSLAKAGPMDSLSFLDFARTQLSQDLSQEVER